MIKATIDYDKYGLIPIHMRAGFRLYIEDGIHRGHFLTALFENDLAGAISRADHINEHKLKDMMQWIYNEAPNNCWGSKEKVNNWKGLNNITGD